MGSKLLAKDKYLNKTFTSKHGEVFKVISYVSNTEVVVQYEDGVTSKCKTVDVRKGKPPNPNRITTCGRGFTGEGKYTISVNGVKTPSYIKWQAMLSRVYGKDNKSTLCYDGCSVDPAWFNFQNFAQWFETEQSKLEVYKGKMCLDKDLLDFKAKEYSSSTCVLLPYEVNIAIQLITKVYFDKRRGTFESRLTRSQDGQSCNMCSLGSYSSPTEAIDKYCIEKDQYLTRLSFMYAPYLSGNAIKSLSNFNTKQRLQFKGVK